MNQPFNKAQQQGITLVELLVTLVLIGIFSAIAIPALDTFAVSQRVKSNAQDIVNIANYARAESIRRNIPVMLVPASIKADFKLNGPGGNWYENGKNTGALAFTRTMLGPLGLYRTTPTSTSSGTPNDATAIKLRTVNFNEKVKVQCGARRVTSQDKDGLNNVGFYFQPNGIVRVFEIPNPLPKLGQNVDLSKVNLQIGYVGRCTVENNVPGGKPHTKVVVIANNGHAQLCLNTANPTAVCAVK